MKKSCLCLHVFNGKLERRSIFILIYTFFFFHSISILGYLWDIPHCQSLQRSIIYHVGVDNIKHPKHLAGLGLGLGPDVLHGSQESERSERSSSSLLVSHLQRSHISASHSVRRPDPPPPGSRHDDGETIPAHSPWSGPRFPWQQPHKSRKTSGKDPRSSP